MMKAAWWHCARCVLALAVCSSATAFGQEWAEKMFDRLKVDFGVVARGADTQQRVLITNPYKQAVNISGVRTTCGCSAAKPSQSRLEPGETAYVEVTMDTRRFMRRKDSNVIVTFDQPAFAEVRIPITAYIRTDVVLTPGSANFGPVPAGEEVRRTIKVAYAGRESWTLQEVRGQNEHLTAEMVETGRGGGRVNYEVHIVLKSTAPIGTFREQLTLVTDDANSPFVPLLVEAQIEPDITITPAVVALGLLTPGQEKTVNVVLRGRKPFAIEKIECESDRRAFKVRLPETEKQVHVLPLTVTPPAADGAFSEEFIVTIAGRPTPLTFKAYGQITTH